MSDAILADLRTSLAEIYSGLGPAALSISCWDRLTGLQVAHISGEPAMDALFNDILSGIDQALGNSGVGHLAGYFLAEHRRTSDGVRLMTIAVDSHELAIAVLVNADRALLGLLLEVTLPRLRRTLDAASGLFAGDTVVLSPSKPTLGSSASSPDSPTDDSPTEPTPTAPPSAAPPTSAAAAPWYEAPVPASAPEPFQLPPDRFEPAHTPQHEPLPTAPARAQVIPPPPPPAREAAPIAAPIPQADPLEVFSSIASRLLGKSAQAAIKAATAAVRPLSREDAVELLATRLGPFGNAAVNEFRSKVS